MPRRIDSHRTIALLLPLQLFLAAGWLRAGVEKVIDPGWWTGQGLLGFLDEQRPEMLPYFGPFADGVIEPWAGGVAWLVLVVQLVVGGCLLTNRHVRPALWAGVILNVSFVMAGRVNPSAFYLVMEAALLLALSRLVSVRIAHRRAVLWVFVGALSLPFVRTLHPAEAIDDPALMLAFVPMLVAVATVAMATESMSLGALVEVYLPRLGRAVVPARQPVPSGDRESDVGAAARVLVGRRDASVELSNLGDDGEAEARTGL